MDFAEQLKSQLNIVDVIGEYVRLKRQGSGARYAGLCPFHQEKTPSFSVNRDQQFYYCFGGCGGGDVFKFVQQIETLSFPETLKFLAERYGIPMPERQRPDDPEAQRRAALYEMQEIAATTFQDNLRGTAGTEARKYLESRNVSKASMDEFRIGLSDASGQQLVQRLQKFGPALIEESGLIGKRESGGHYDVFRARLMFPIHDAGGKVIGFGGRALRPDGKQKYINSPATKLYNKSTVLYNLHRAKIEARKRDRMILVEGYMDVIGVYAAGIKEVVASSGTSFGPEQVRMIKQQTGSGCIILNFDSDKAGAGATEKYITPCLAEDLRVKILEIPGGLDPDELIQKNGADSYRKLLDSADSCFHWLADRARNKFDMNTAEGRVDAFKFIWPSIQHVHDRLERSAIANEMAEYLRVDREVIRQEFKRLPKAESPQKARAISSAVAPNEKLLLTCLLASQNARVAIRHYLANSGDFMAPLELRSIFELILRFDEDSRPFSLEAIAGALESRFQRILAEISFSELGMPEEGAAEQALQCLRALETKANDARAETLRRQVRELEQSGNFAEAMRLAEELNTLKRANSGG